MCFPVKFSKYLRTFFSTQHLRQLLLNIYNIKLFAKLRLGTAQNCGFDQIHRKLRIGSHLLKKSLMENFIFCAVRSESNQRTYIQSQYSGSNQSPLLLKPRKRIDFPFFSALLRFSGSKKQFHAQIPQTRNKIPNTKQSKKDYVISFYKFHPFYKAIWKMADMKLILKAQSQV